MAFYFGLIEAHDTVEGVFHKTVAWRQPYGQAPNAECPFAVQVFGCGKHLCIVVGFGVDEDGGCASNAPCGAHAWLHVFVGRFETVGDGVIVFEAERFCLGRIEADGHDGGVGAHLVNDNS